MNAEEIILKNVQALSSFIQHFFGGDIAAKELKQYTDSWHETWPRIQNWLIQTNETILINKYEAIKDFMMKMLPNNTTAEGYYEEIKCHLINSFIIHEEFWNHFFENLLNAKLKLLAN